MERKITNSTKGIIPAHLYGNMAEMNETIKAAKNRDLFVIEDCAEAHGAVYKGRKVETIGHVGCFSFYQNRIFTTGGEGGAIVTDDEERFCDHGCDVETWLSLLEAE